MSKKGYKLTAETRAKMSAVRKGRKPTAETRANMSMAQKGHEVTAETRVKMSATMRGRYVGVNNPRWKGGRRVDRFGYINIFRPDHPFASLNGCIREHRLVMEAHIGRVLLPTEIVHHVNGINGDNRIENLMLFSSQSEHVSKAHKKRDKKS